MTTSRAEEARQAAQSPEKGRNSPRRSQGNAALIAAACAVAALCGLVFAGALLAGASMLLYGGTLALGLLALTFAVRRFFAAAYPRVEIEEEREIGSEAPEGPLAHIEPVRRRTLLQRILLGAAAVMGVGLLAPISTLGPRPPDVQRGTGWRSGVRVVDPAGRPLRADDVPAGGLAIVWPEGAVREELASVILLRLTRGQVEPPTNLDWVVNGELVAYSKICTHVGCPVGLFQARTGSLFCPCHQQVFDASRGATPTFGPAARPLPQLPLAVGDEDYLIALGDFADPVGPAVG